MRVGDLILALLVLYGLGALAVKLGMNKLTCQRRFTRTAVFEGDRGELVEMVRNDTPFLLPWLRVETRISQNIQLGSQENLELTGGSYYCSFFTLLPYQQIRRTHQVAFLRRGTYDLGNAALSSGDVLGMAEFTKQQQLSTQVLVYPRMIDPEQMPLPIVRQLGELTRRRQLLTDPFLVRGIRPYQPGDPVRDIHWAATAKTGDIQLRVRDYTARTRLLVVMNVQYQDLQLNSYIPEEQEQPVEEMIRLAATICIQALREGMAAGFAANMPSSQVEQPVMLLPEDGAAQEERILAEMAGLRIHCAQRFPAFLEDLMQLKGTDLLILSRYDSESIRLRIRALEAAGIRVQLHVTEGGRG